MTTLEHRATDTPDATQTPQPAAVEVSFDTSPEAYKHWTLSVDGEVATLTLDVAEDGGIVPGYELKMNSYDLGVDIELHDAVQRVRFEHPEAKALVSTTVRTSGCSNRSRCIASCSSMSTPRSYELSFSS